MLHQSTQNKILNPIYDIIIHSYQQKNMITENPIVGLQNAQLLLSDCSIIPLHNIHNQRMKSDSICWWI